ncbi:uncharacterized protein LOC126418799 isoform X1 [Schistocerca serialis cubense]|uniref:uncharacterized protein LOC126418799 isoform X1 n=1 Tax=Schistocerca serialis cubense TaxID=2023355 RepID=UPI00214EFDF5|nr:uncharacterized protein LOC126418799 isoform X1 [Schistocerca serialis cubense]
MSSRPACFIVLLCIAIGVAAGDQPPVQDNSGTGEILVLEFPGHPTAYCGYQSHPEVAIAGSSLRFTVVQRGEDGRGVRDTYYCVLAGDEVDFKQLAEDNMLAVRRGAFTDGEPALELGRVHCVLQPAASVPAEVFDFRATRLASGLPAFLCLRLDAASSLAEPLVESAAPPVGDALVFRFIRVNVPDLVCRPFSDVPLSESDIEVELFGFLHPASGPLNCRFRRVYEGQSAAELLNKLSQEMRAQLVIRQDLPPTLTLPNFTCQEAMRADQPAPPADDLSPSSSPAFAVTGPSSRWTLCWTSLQHALEDVTIEFPNVPRIMCRSHEVPAVPSLNDTEFYFVLQLGSSSRLLCRFAGLPKFESADAEARLHEMLDKSSREMGATLRPEGSVLVLETPPAACVDSPGYSGSSLYDGAQFVYSVRGKTQLCVLAKREASPSQPVLSQPDKFAGWLPIA